MKSVLLSLLSLMLITACTSIDKTKSKNEQTSTSENIDSKSESKPIFSKEALASLPVLKFPSSELSNEEKRKSMETQLMSFPFMQERKKDCLAENKKFLLVVEESVTDGKQNTNYRFECE